MISCRYLTNKQDQEAFESAHSVMLAIFSKKKPISMELAKFYTDVLLQSYPDLLSISQLRLAFASMVTCLTDLESSEADRCILQLIHAIESLAPGPSRHQQAEVPLAEVGQSQQTAEAMSTKQENSLSATPLSAKALEAAAVGSRRGHLLLVLIDQLSTTTLAKMEGLLPIVQAFLHEEKRAPAQSRLALIQVLFNTLSGGMDMVKRESAAKWWLEHRSEIESGENDGASEGNYNATENDEKAGHVTSLVARL